MFIKSLNTTKIRISLGQYRWHRYQYFSIPIYHFVNVFTLGIQLLSLTYYYKSVCLLFVRNSVVNVLFSICFNKLLVNIYEICLKMASNSNYNFANFRVNSIINNSTKNKTVCLVGNFLDINETDRALVILEKTAFTGLFRVNPIKKTIMYLVIYSSFTN